MKILYLHLGSLQDKHANIIQVLHMCRALQHIGVDVTLALPGGDCGPDNISSIEEEMGKPVNFKVQYFPRPTIGGRFMSLGAYWGIKAILDRNSNHDYCYVRNPFLAQLAIGRGLRTIYEEHDEKMHPLWWMNKWWIRKLLKSARSADFIKIIAISQALAEIWRKRGIPPQKILVLHDGVSLDDYKDLKSREVARADLGIKDKKKIVIYVGSLYKDRGIEEILKLAHSFPEVQFMIVGGPEKNKIIYESGALNRGLSNMAFTGRVPHYQVKDYLFAADVLLMLWSRRVPTIRVCSPLKVFEYMAAERIIVGHGFPTIREVLKDGETAFLADPDSFEDLKRKMSQALSLDYPNDMAKKARKVALQNYTWEGRARAIVEALGSDIA